MPRRVFNCRKPINLLKLYYYKKISSYTLKSTLCSKGTNSSQEYCQPKADLPRVENSLTINIKNYENSYSRRRHRHQALADEP